MKDNLRRKTEAELEARRQRMLKVLEGEPPEPAKMEQMLGRIEDEQAKRQRLTKGSADIAIKRDG